jgi:hypothetical protein
MALPQAPIALGLDFHRGSQTKTATAPVPCFHFQPEIPVFKYVMQVYHSNYLLMIVTDREKALTLTGSMWLLFCLRLL